MDDVELQNLEIYEQHPSPLTYPHSVPEFASLRRDSRDRARLVAPSLASSNRSKRSLVVALKSPKHKLWTSIKKLWTNTWLVEIASAIASVISLLAIVIIFLKYNGKQPPQWPHGLTINTIISIFATAMVTFLGPALGSGLGIFIWLYVNE